MRSKLAVLAGILSLALAAGVGTLTHEASAPTTAHTILANGTGPGSTGG
ncbi:hypothetical protein ABZ896_20360 [Streptomyces sp. NPDC047072]